MEKRTLNKESIQSFERYLMEEERSKATISKYLHDVTHFIDFTKDFIVHKEIVLQYKEELTKTFAITSANSMLAAVNTFLRYLGWEDCCVKHFKVQKEVYCSDSKELKKSEYDTMIQMAEKTGKKRLSLLLQTLGATGIRASELQFITVEALKQGEAMVTCKGKSRKILLSKKLIKKLSRYAKEQNITSGSIFVTRNGNPLDRSNIWKEMKRLSKLAGIKDSKVFPHNLRHLFARAFYNMDKDIARLADLLGHSSINTTRIYIMSTGTEHRQKMEAMHMVL